MKLRLSLMLFCLFVIGCLNAQAELNFGSNLPDSLQEAVKLAEKSRNADLYYNLGVDFFSLGEVGSANLYFLRALNIDSAHKYARANLETTIRLGQDARLYPEHLFLVRVFLQILDFFSVNRLAVISLILLLATAGVLVWLLFFDPEKERALPILLLAFFLLLCLASFIALGIKSYQQKNNSRAVLQAAVSSFYPPKGDAALFQVHAGLWVKVLNDKGAYWLVQLPDGQTGRIKAADLEKVLP